MQFVVNKNIARILKEKGIRQKEVALKAGFGVMVISNIVNCKRNVYADEVVPIALALGVQIEELFREERKNQTGKGGIPTWEKTRL